MRERAEAMVLASFAADSHALGAHWIYDTEEIASRYGRVERLLPPPPDSLHSGRPKGSFTHYGDQTMTLLRHLASNRSFDQDAFTAEWRRFMESYPGYRDRATARTPANGTGPDGAGANSTELAPAARIAPLVYLYRDEQVRLVDLARAQAVVTHNTPLAAGCAGFLAKVLWIVLNGKTPDYAIRSVLEDSAGSEVAGLVRGGLDSIKQDTRAAALAFGQGCSIAAALPLAIHLIAKYEGSLKEALVENVAAGGDSAARGMVVGMVLGAFHGHDAIPDDWIEDMLAYDEISRLLEDLEAARQHATNGSAHGR